MLPRDPKRGGIRETVGFEERKAERGKGKDGEEDWGMVRGMGRGGAGRCEHRPAPPHSLQCVIANQ